MKKLLLTALLLGATAGAYAQGVVQFRNWLANPPINAIVTVQGAGAADANYRAALIGGPVGSVQSTDTVLGNMNLMYYSANTTLTWVNFRATGTTPPAAPGYVNVGSTAGRVVPGVDWGGQAMVQMVAWSGTATTWQDAWNQAHTDPNVWIGFSDALTLRLPTSATDPNSTYLVGLNAFTIHPVPEPTSLALAGLGAAALLIFRRRK